MTARPEEGCHEIIVCVHVLYCEGLSNNGVGVTRGAVLQEIRPGAGFKNRRFGSRKVGGATVVRLSSGIASARPNGLIREKAEAAISCKGPGPTRKKKEIYQYSEGGGRGYKYVPVWHNNGE